MLVPYILFALGIVSPSLAKRGKLLNVIQVYRHGERSPTAFYPNDPYQDISYWGVSEGQLTNYGKLQHYELGQYTRQRYKDFLPRRYAREDFLVQSTSLDRTFMSAQSQLAGLFPPKGDQVWNKYILWQPIPVFLTDERIMSASSFSCTRYSNLYSEVLSSNEYYVKFNEENRELYEYVSNHTGSNITSLMEAYLIYDTLYIEERQKYTLPEWTKSVYPAPLNSAGAPFFLSFTFTEELKVLFVGPFLNAIVEQFDGYLKDPSSSKKYIQYSAHDTNIASILNALGAYDPPIPPFFASTIYIELWERNGSHYINIYYKNYGGPERITVAGCDFDCRWEDFKSILSNRTTTFDEWAELCNS